jgi:putative colanic acid biosynthesis glycosyltransferase
MPKIIQISVEGNMGSTGTIAESIGEIAISRGWESYIAFGRFKRTSKSTTIKIGNLIDILIHGLLTRIFDLHGYGSKHATKKLIKQINHINPDIIHLHNLHGYYINIEVLFEFLSKVNIPVIWTFHDCWPMTGHCSHFDFVGCDKWKIECNNCPQLREYPKSLFLDRSRKNYYSKKKLFTSVDNLTVVSVSNWLNNIVEKSFMNKLSSRVIYNGIDINLFSPERLNNCIRDKYCIQEKFMILGVATTWTDRKGLKDFLELSKYIDSNIIIVLIGLSSSQIKNLPKNIIGLKRTENKQELRDLYVECDVYMNLSVEETFGLTTAEALACGTPAIVYNSTASPELIDRSTGIVVEKQNIQNILLALDEISRNGKLYYSEACRSRAINLFDQKNRFNEYFELYDEKLKNINSTNF